MSCSWLILGTFNCTADAFAPKVNTAIKGRVPDPIPLRFMSVSFVTNNRAVIAHCGREASIAFCDADKTWYSNYLDAVLPKLSENGCYTAHNVKNRMRGIAEFLEHLESTEVLETSIQGSFSGVSVSYKRARP